MVLVMLVLACTSSASGPAQEVDGSPLPSASATIAVETVGPADSPDFGVRLCSNIQRVGDRLASLNAVGLRTSNRVALEIELGKLEAAYSELRQADLGELEERLEALRRRIGYRIDELKLAVEDFRTNARPKRAVPHVEKDAASLSDAVASFGILARC
ncbi:MAG: hypothetical protein ACC726_06825 [Chloroflexota bacterium]